MNFNVYDKKTGEILRSVVCDKDNIESQLQNANEFWIEGLTTNDFDVFYVKNANLVKKPDKPNDWCVFDCLTEKWVPNFELANNFAKYNRQMLLTQTDWTQLPNSPLNEQKKQEWSIYRQQLRDITSQPEYPFEIQWPKQPQG